MLGNSATAAHVGDTEIAEVITRALEYVEPRVREHSAGALARLERRVDE